MHAFQNYACVNPLLQSESNNKSVIRLLNKAIGALDNPLPFPAQLDCLNNYAYPSIQSLVFPSLFLRSAGDVTFHDYNLPTSFTDSNTHLLKHSFHNHNSDTCVHSFAKHNRHMH